MGSQGLYSGNIDTGIEQVADECPSKVMRTKPLDLGLRGKSLEDHVDGLVGHTSGLKAVGLVHGYEERSRILTTMREP